MNINKKIEEIRRAPEYIRLRYVWGSVAISMLIILAIWLFSIVSLFQEGKTAAPQDASGGISDLKDQLQKINTKAPSLKDSTQPLTVGNEGVANSQNTNDFKYPATENAAQTPQSNQYSDLPATQTAQ